MGAAALPARSGPGRSDRGDQTCVGVGGHELGCYFHPEAVSRVETLWRAWEHLRLDGATGINVWFKDHADHHMSVLLDPRGPFYKCDMQKHRDPEHLEPKKASNGWFPDVRVIEK
ncbi:hypothetical protein GCM10027405_38920 [Arthrobacter alkaliphilus]